MFKNTVGSFKVCIGTLVFLAATNANAQIYSFADSAGTASLEVVATSSTTFDFTFSFLTGVGNFSYIDLLVFNASPFSPLPSLSAYSGAGVAQPSVIASGTTPAGVNYSFGFDFADSGANRLQAGETASWTTTFASAPVIFNNVELVYRNNGGNGATGLVGVAAVPEPETYAMFLAGLGLLTFAIRKRQS